VDCQPRRERGAEVQAFDVAFFEATTLSEDWTRELAEMLELPHPILTDPGKRMALAYGVLGAGRAAVARWTFYIGIDGRILFIDRNVTADGHGEEVPARLRLLGFAPRTAR
jgi:thioredoxin-dependent peroxiredoxin